MIDVVRRSVGAGRAHGVGRVNVAREDADGSEVEIGGADRAAGEDCRGGRERRRRVTLSGEWASRVGVVLVGEKKSEGGRVTPK